MFSSGIAIDRFLRRRSDWTPRFHIRRVCGTRVERMVRETIPRRILFHKRRITTDAGVWNGHAYDDIPAITTAT